MNGLNALTEDKMASKHLSMAEELLNAITELHTKVLCLLHDSRITSVENFKRQHVDLMKHHWIDSSILLTPDKLHPTTTGIFEVYGKKAGLNANELKEMLIDWMCDQSKQTFPEWLQRITLKEKFVLDELTIYCLSRFLNIHTLVYTSNFCWSTLINQFKYDDDELYNKSDIRFVYVGYHMFAELKHIRQPRPTLTLMTVPTTTTATGNARKKMGSARCGKKVTNRGDKPRSKQNRKTSPPALPPPPSP